MRFAIMNGALLSSRLCQALLGMLFLTQALTGCAAHGRGQAHDLPRLMVERLGLMDEVAQVKQAKGLPVTDARREAELLAAMAREGTALGLPATAVRAFFSGQVEAAKEYQREWLADPAHKTAVPAKKLPDLATEVRPALDAIGKNMLAALVRTRGSTEPRAVVAAARTKLTEAGYSAVVIRPALDGLAAAVR